MRSQLSAAGAFGGNFLLPQLRAAPASTALGGDRPPAGTWENVTQTTLLITSRGRTRGGNRRCKREDCELLGGEQTVYGRARLRNAVGARPRCWRKASHSLFPPINPDTYATSSMLRSVSTSKRSASLTRRCFQIWAGEEPVTSWKRRSNLRREHANLRESSSRPIAPPLELAELLGERAADLGHERALPVSEQLRSRCSRHQFGHCSTADWKGRKPSRHYLATTPPTARKNPL